jgi:hypothetical protein
MRFEKLLVPGAMIAILAGAACAPKSNEASGTGGATATGGKTESGGTTGSGGASGTGGAPGTGGESGTGGATGMGGKSGTGGSSGTGGATAAGGASGQKGGAGGGGTNVGGTGKTGGTMGGGGSTAAGGSTGTGGATFAVDCKDTSTTKLSFTTKYEDGSIKVDNSTKTYYTMTNWWNVFSGQTVTVNGLSMKIGNPKNVTIPPTDGNPAGFPTMFIGAYQGHETVGSNLPMQVTAIKSAPTIFQTNASTLDTSNLNVTYDVWFTSGGKKLSGIMDNNPGKGGAYIMVWMFKPSARQPRGGVISATGEGTPNYPAHKVDGVEGDWDVWVDSKSDPLCISYVSSKPIDGLAFDLNKFIQDSVTNKYGITTSMYLNLVFAGTEIWGGGDGLEIKQFCAAVN